MAKLLIIDACNSCPHFTESALCEAGCYCNHPDVGAPDVLDPSRIPQWCPLADLAETVVLIPKKV